MTVTEEQLDFVTADKVLKGKPPPYPLNYVPPESELSETIKETAIENIDKSTGELSQAIESNFKLSLPTATQLKDDSLMEAILRIINDSPLALTPTNITKILRKTPKWGKAKHSTIKVYLRRLVAQNLIRLYMRGWYCNFKPHEASVTVGSEGGLVYADDVRPSNTGLLLQNIVCTLDIPIVYMHGDVIIESLDSKVVITFGVTHNRISFRLSGDRGVSIHSFDLYLKLIESNIISLGYLPPFMWKVSNYELLQDGISKRLEGLECYTVQDFEGELYKIYNKPYGVRAEYKTSTPVSIGDFMAVLSDRSADLRLVSRQTAVEDKLNKLIEAVKRSNAGKYLNL